ncbi:MAG: hypothetical protein ACFCVK_17095 [Acidimicrobiales bacterium]
MLSDTPWAATPTLRTRRTLTATIDLATGHAGRATVLGARPGDADPDGVLDGIDTDPDAAVLAVTVLWSPAWSSADLGALAARLGPGRLLFVEPTAGLGWRRVLQRALAPVFRRLLGHDFDRDVPAELRRAGFLVTAVDRFHTDRAGILSYAYGEAIRRSR